MAKAKKLLAVRDALSRVNFCVGSLKPCHHTALGAEAARHYGYTRDLEEAGYVMPNGRFLDFSGRHEHPDYEYDARSNSFRPKPGRRDEQLYQKVVDHRDVSGLKLFKAQEDERGDPISPIYTFMVATGAIRINHEAGIEAASIPTERQARALAVAWRQIYPDQLRIEVELWLTPREVVTEEVRKPITGFKIINAVQKMWPKCRCVSGLEPCCHRGKASGQGLWAVRLVGHPDKYLTKGGTFEREGFKTWKLRKYADRAIDTYHDDEVAKGFRDDLTDLEAVKVDE